MSKPSPATTTYGPPVCRPTPFPISEPWPFHLGAQAIFVFAAPDPEGMVLRGEWHPVDANPSGLIVARLGYEVAGDVDRLQTAVAPIYDCYMRTEDQDLQRDLMNSASLLAHLMEQHQSPHAEEWFERQYLGYETHRMSE